MASLDPVAVLETRLQDADTVLASIDMRLMSSDEAASLAVQIRRVLEQKITEENVHEAQELLGRYRALTLG